MPSLILWEVVEELLEDIRPTYQTRTTSHDFLAVTLSTSGGE